MRPKSGKNILCSWKKASENPFATTRTAAFRVTGAPDLKISGAILFCVWKLLYNIFAIVNSYAGARMSGDLLNTIAGKRFGGGSPDSVNRQGFPRTLYDC